MTRAIASEPPRRQGSLMNATLRVAPLIPLRLVSVELCLDSANTVIDGSSRMML